MHAAINESGNNRQTSRLNRLSTWNLFTLSLGMAGSQVAWTVELGYGTPFLLSLGLSEQLTSLVWLAGPISGIIAQPLIGAVSDNSTSRYRRRFWIAWSTVVLVISCLALAYAETLGTFFTDFFGGGVGDWDPKGRKESKKIAIGIAVTAFYLLDFSLNALQASLRNLLLDVTPPEQLSSGNAWHGRMTHAGNILGYGFGFLNLTEWPILRSLGGTQFRKVCMVGIIIIVVTVWVTCWTQEEVPQSQNTEHSNLKEIYGSIRSAVVSLPNPVKKVCFVQLFAFMAWFPFLFYATTYIGQVMARQNNAEPDQEVAARTGNFALLMYSLVGVVAGTLLPHLSKRDERLLDPEYPETDDEKFARIETTILAWKIESEARGQSLKLPRMPVALRDVWCFALVFFALISGWTFFINTVAEAIVAVALVGVCWAIVVWAPFAIIMEFLKEVEEEIKDEMFAEEERFHPNDLPHSHSISRATENTALLDNEMLASVEPSRRSVAGGTVLGIHNLSISFPQFIVAMASSLIFRIVDGASESVGDGENIYLGKNGVAWVLRYGGLSALAGALATRLIPPTKQERVMRENLRLMKEARDML
ncbi:hypothetical protein M422DRAFT_57368 [Sphaerobolus stellatus SS14]|nr:hypothetical protein M422DRAFT_57368 [Sphaerobolus stellatus SS14]